MGWRYPIDFISLLILGSVYFFITFLLLLFVIFSKKKSCIKTIGEMYFGIGIGFLSGGVVAYDFKDDTQLFIIFFGIGILSLLIGTIIKGMAEKMKS